MAPLPYVPGSNDSRTYFVRGIALRVWRRPSARGVGFNGHGRDVDYVPEDAPEPAALQAIIAGIAGVSPSGPTDLVVETEAALATIEARMADAAGGPFTISRDAGGVVAVARALLDSPVADGMSRMWSLRGAWSLTVTETPDGGATATPWAWGKNPGNWLATTLAAMGVAAVVVSGEGNAAVRALPRARVRELLERALENPLLGAAAFLLNDTQLRR